MSNSLDTPINPNSIKSDGPIQVSNVMKDDFDFEIPQESVPLPSEELFIHKKDLYTEKKLLILNL